MDIRVSGHHVNVGDAFRDYATSRLQGVVGKYFTQALSAHVTLGREAHGHGFHVDCTLHVRRGVTLKAEASATEAQSALDTAVDRIETQLRRYKRKLKNHHAADTRSDIITNEAQSYVMQAHPPHEEVPEEHHPIIIAESKVDVPTVSVADAVMLMDFAHAPVLMFRDTRTQHVGMVYRRGDGNIGWIDSGAVS